MNDKKLTNQLLGFYKKPVATVSLELIMTVAMVILLAVFAIKPTLETMGALSKEIKEKTELETKLKQKVAALSTAQSEYLAKQNELLLLDNALPSTDTTINDLKTIEKIAYQSNVVITLISLSPLENQTKDDGKQEKNSDKKPKAVVNRPISLSIEGDYLSIKSFVANLINNRRVFMINSVSFSIRKQRSGGESLSASLSINSPFYF